ncbi:flavin monoamine oxidase family protein [Streptomyces sp. URMC 129]|uniref:flavin monoamine oxidase family protein n=1 Tax=Streptomyces sp. URMC 129 TaxID=3423407 RepID=UPI003F1ACBD8
MNGPEARPWPDGGEPAIAVLGAGISGLVAAWELERLGHDVVVLEADARVGGRVLTHRFAGPGGPLVELGAMRIAPDHALTLRYVDRLGLRPRLRPFANILSDPGNRLRVGRRLVRVRDAAGPLVRDTEERAGGGSHRPEALLFTGWLHAMVRALGPAELRVVTGRDLGKLLATADRLDLAPFVAGGRADIGGALLAHPELRAACDARLEGFLDDLVRESGPGMVRLAGGMAQLTEGIATRLRRPVRTGHAVTGIDVRPDGVRVRLGGRYAPAAVTFPIVLCTIPFSALRRLPLTGLSDDKLKVIRTLDYGAATKVALHCREAFWRADGIGGGGSAPGGLIRQTYYPPAEGDPGTGAALLGSYTIAEDADVLGRLPRARRHAAVLGELRGLHPRLGPPPAVRDMVSVAWGERPWHHGCAARRWGLTGADLAREAERTARPQGRLFFAGEHCSPTPAWINAGIETALDAVARIDALARRTGGPAGTGASA